MAATLPRQVEVLHEGRWLAGWVHAVRRDPEGTWLGLVTYYDGRWLQYYHWRPGTELRALARPLDGLEGS